MLIMTRYLMEFFLFPQQRNGPMVDGLTATSPLRSLLSVSLCRGLSRWLPQSWYFSNPFVAQQLQTRVLFSWTTNSSIQLGWKLKIESWIVLVQASYLLENLPSFVIFMCDVNGQFSSMGSFYRQMKALVISNSWIHRCPDMPQESMLKLDIFLFVF